MPLPGTAIEACDARDPFCQNPVTPEVMTDARGIAHLFVPGSFTGFYGILRSDSYPTLYYAGRLLAGEPHVTYPVAPDNYALSAVLSLNGVVPNRDPNVKQGLMVLTAYDCLDRAASGVTFELTNSTAPLTFYIHNHIPSSTASETDSEGTGGFVDAPEGITDFVSNLPNGHRLTGSVFVRAASGTFVDVRPRVRDLP
jgi:hypothetical protein